MVSILSQSLISEFNENPFAISLICCCSCCSCWSRIHHGDCFYYHIQTDSLHMYIFSSNIRITMNRKYDVIIIWLHSWNVQRDGFVWSRSLFLVVSLDSVQNVQMWRSPLFFCANINVNQFKHFHLLKCWRLHFCSLLNHLEYAIEYIVVMICCNSNWTSHSPCVPLCVMA